MERNLEIGYRNLHPKFGWYEVISKVDNQNFVVRFDSTNYEYTCSKYHILDNYVCDRKNSFFHQIGEKYKHPIYGEYTIVEITGNKKAIIEFDKTKHRYETTIHNIIHKNVKDVFYPLVYGIGYVGEHKGKNISKNLAYRTWKNMLKRCYDVDFLNNRPTYKGCYVCKEWLCFLTFKEWFDKHYVEGWCLDKDIIFKGNKEYAPDKCCFVPNEINVLFTKRQNYRGNTPIGVRYYPAQYRFKECYKAFLSNGSNKSYLGCFKTTEDAFNAYKIAKEKWIKEVADKWKDKLEPKVYKAIYEYKVEITD